MAMRLRLMKDAYQKDTIRRVARVRAEGMAVLMRAAKPGMNEFDAAGSA